VFCTKCGAENQDDNKICAKCGANMETGETVVDAEKVFVNQNEKSNMNSATLKSSSVDNNLIYFLLKFFLGFIGCLIINYSSLKPVGYKARTLAHFFLTSITFGIYGIVASICALFFDPNKPSNIGFFKE